jgi:hypothetical protein
LNGAPVAGVLPVSAAASCPGVVAHIVSEQVMAAHAKSKAAANLLRLGFIDFSLGLGFWFLRPCGVSFFAAAQMCFYRVKRKPRPKPAKFLYAVVEGGVFEDVFLMSLSWGNSFSRSRSLKENRSA